MHPSALLLLLTVAAATGGVHGYGRPAEGTPAAKFWDQALPGSPMPEAIAELVQKGIDHKPLAHNSSDPYIGQAMWSCTLSYNYGCAPAPPSTVTVKKKKNTAAEAAAVEAPTGVFFSQEQARVGTTMDVYLPATAAGLPGILPRNAAARTPFGDSAAVLARFGIAPASKEADQVHDTLSSCRAQPLRGEKKACATSLEAIVGAATRMLATPAGSAGGGVMWATASDLPRDGLPRQAYAVTAVAALDGDRHVACHDRPFPYAVYQCHGTGPSSTRALMVTLQGLHSGAPEVAMAAICHLDTSAWDPEHPAFQALNTKPGAEPVCHFMPYAHLLFGDKQQ